MKITLYSVTTLMLICTVAEQGHSFGPAGPLRGGPKVPDYISKMPSLKHCNEIPNNVGDFSVSRVQCGCNDNEEKRGVMLGQTRAGFKELAQENPKWKDLSENPTNPWIVTKFSAYCSMADEIQIYKGEQICMCPHVITPMCKPGEIPKHCSCCGCTCKMPPLPPRADTRADTLDDEGHAFDEQYDGARGADTVSLHDGNVDVPLHLAAAVLRMNMKVGTTVTGIPLSKFDRFMKFAFHVDRSHTFHVGFDAKSGTHVGLGVATVRDWCNDKFQIVVVAKRSSNLQKLVAALKKDLKSKMNPSKRCSRRLRGY